MNFPRRAAEFAERRDELLRATGIRRRIKASRAVAKPFRASTKGLPRFRVRATRGFRADATASRPEGAVVAGRRRAKPPGLRRGGGSPRSVAVRRGRGSRRFVFCGAAAEPKAVSDAAQTGAGA